MGVSSKHCWSCPGRSFGWFCFGGPRGFAGESGELVMVHHGNLGFLETFNLRCRLMCWALDGACWRVWCRRWCPLKNVLWCTVTLWFRAW